MHRRQLRIQLRIQHSLIILRRTRAARDWTADPWLVDNLLSHNCPTEMNTFSFSKAFWICERCKAPLTLFTVQQAIWRVVGSLCNHDWHCYTSAYNYEEALFAKVRLFSWDTVGLHILVLGIFLFWQTCLIFKVSDRSSKKLILFICSMHQDLSLHICANGGLASW